MLQHAVYVKSLSLLHCDIVSDLFVYRDEKLTSQKSIMLNEQVHLHGENEVENGMQICQPM